MIPELGQIPVPQTVAIVATYLLARGTLGEAGKDAYDALKTRILTWIAKEHVDRLEEKPDSEARQMTVAEELNETDAAQDPELARLTEALSAAIERGVPAETRAALLKKVSVKGLLKATNNVAEGDGAIAVSAEDIEVGGNMILDGNVARREPKHEGK